LIVEQQAPLTHDPFGGNIELMRAAAALFVHREWTDFIAWVSVVIERNARGPEAITNLRALGRVLCTLGNKVEEIAAGVDE